MNLQFISYYWVFFAELRCDHRLSRQRMFVPDLLQAETESTFFLSPQKRAVATSGILRTESKDTIMKRQSIRPPFIAPFFLWMNLAVKTSEMMMASAQVIGHRTGRMASSGAIPSVRDQREFTLMGQEKIDALTESSQAMATRLIFLHQQVGSIAFRQMFNGITGLLSLATCRSLDQSSRRQAELMRTTIANSTALASHLSGSMLHLADHGLRPIYSRATGNAKRLLKNNY